MTAQELAEKLGQRRPDGRGGWLWNLDGIEPVLYRLPEVLDAVPAGRVVYIVEGERDVETLRMLGLTATCNPMGAGKWRAAYNEPLRSANVVILPDNDEPGHKHAQQVAQSLYGIATSLKVVTLPDLPAKGDVSDWVAVGGTRDSLERLITQAAAWSPEPSASQDKTFGTVWQRAVSAVDFVNQEEDEHQSLTADLVYPGCITLIAAPRGTGKSIVALILGVVEVTGGTFRGERLRQVRVLYVDRDNSPWLIRDRLRRIGVHGAENLRLITRLDAPPLTDRQAWLALPWQQYDVVVIDSIGAATEGVSEKEGKETQHFLATLKDLAQRGLAIIALDNTIKAGTNYRGRGEKADAVDILYEARDITNWTPKHEDWWEHLPEAGDHTWASRASRHRNKTHMRIAFVASKFRLGMDPEPFALEIDFRGDCWTLRDVTEELAQAGAETRDIDRKAKQDLFRQATEALVSALRQRPPDSLMTKTEAEAFLMDQHLRRTEARNLLEANHGHAWHMEIAGNRRGRPTVVVPLSLEKSSDSGEKDQAPESSDNTGSAQIRFSPVAFQADSENRSPEEPHYSMTSSESISAESQTSTWRKSDISITSNKAGETDMVISAAEQSFSTDITAGDDEEIMEWTA